MKVLADADYANRHAYSTDGAAIISDIYTGSAWKTILVAGMNAGGKGYYALDITNPGSPQILWEFKNANMGFSFGNPVIGKRGDGTWIVAFTSGYNNADGVGRLFIVRADNGTLLDTISTGVGNAATPSNLGKISAWVDDGLNDNTIQRIYGGDMLGNVWRFDINDILPPAGKDAFKMATLTAGAYTQPITTKPELGLVGTKPVVYVGTGRYLGATDLGDLGQQSVYAIKDRLDAVYLNSPRNNTPCTFVKQTLTALDANTRSVTSNLPVDLDNNNVCGWYIDFNPSDQTPGERINVDMKLQLGVLGILTNIPEQSVCTTGGSSFIYFFDYATGRNVGDFEEITDINNVPSTHAPNKVGERIGNSTGEGFNTIRLPDGKVVTVVTTSDDRHPVYGNPTHPGLSSATRRVLWRELLN
jgi:type IV pilus assembly protein PilY1